MIAVRRRRFLAAAGVTGFGSFLAGCGLTSAVSARFPHSLRVALVGFPEPVATRLATALIQCSELYRRAGGVAVAPVVTKYLFPSASWCQCPPPPAPCGAAAASPSLFALANGTMLDQIPSGNASIVVRSRTALDVRFGDVLPPPTPAPQSVLLAGGPDLIVAYDTWQYWLAPLSVPTGDAWRTYDSWSAGVPQVAQAAASMFVPGSGTLPVAVPVLRNPLGLFVALPSLLESWQKSDPQLTWSGLADWLASQLQRPDTSAFMQSGYYPEGTESALAAMSAYGGRIASGDAVRVQEAFHSQEAVAGIAAWSRIVGHELPGSAPSGGPYTAPLPATASTPARTFLKITPQHIWSPLWGDRGAWDPPWAFHPLPAGPAGRPVPCTSVCAFVSDGNRTGTLAEEFAAFLWSPASQAELGVCHVGLPLRKDAGVSVAQETYPWIQSPDLVADASGDLTAPQVYGVAKSVTNASGVDAAADAFAASLMSLESG